MLIIPDKIVTPQHVRTFFADATPDLRTLAKRLPAANAGTSGATNLLTVYTGSIGAINFDSGEDRNRETYQMPVLGLFAGNTKGIFPFAMGEFTGATATVAMTDLVDKTDPQICQIHSATADLSLVTLTPAVPAGPPIAPLLAVVLTFTLEGQNSIVHGVHYQVTVLSRVGDVSTTNLMLQGLKDPIKIGQAFVGQSWMGGFDRIDSNPAAGTRPGVPQP